jgi:hypothetical protein
MMDERTWHLEWSYEWNGMKYSYHDVLFANSTSYTVTDLIGFTTVRFIRYIKKSTPVLRKVTRKWRRTTEHTYAPKNRRWTACMYHNIICDPHTHMEWYIYIWSMIIHLVSWNLVGKNEDHIDGFDGIERKWAYRNDDRNFFHGVVLVEECHWLWYMCWFINHDQSLDIIPRITPCCATLFISNR